MFLVAGIVDIWHLEAALRNVKDQSLDSAVLVLVLVLVAVAVAVEVAVAVSVAVAVAQVVQHTSIV